MKLINKSTQNNSGLTYLIFKNFSPYPHLKSAVFTRLGGYSLSPYKSLNMGLQVGDNYNTVILNRKKAINEIGFTFNRLIAMEQIHSDNIKIVKREDGGRGAYEWENGIKETDGMICCDRGVTLMAVVADCPVTLFYDFHNGVMGIAHCGWRGTVKSIGRKLLQNLRSHYNSRPSDIIAGVSPGIDICCYEVGEDVFSAFQNEYGSEGKKFFEYRNKKKLPEELMIKATDIQKIAF